MQRTKLKEKYEMVTFGLKRIRQGLPCSFVRAGTHSALQCLTQHVLFIWPAVSPE